MIWIIGSNARTHSFRPNRRRAKRRGPVTRSERMSQSAPSVVAVARINPLHHDRRSSAAPRHQIGRKATIALAAAVAATVPCAPGARADITGFSDPNWVRIGAGNLIVSNTDYRSTQAVGNQASAL